jgi:hypothetical protein
VNGLLETLKRVGAGLIVGVLIIMMGVTFSSQPMDEILSILSGGGKLGHFSGKEISGRVVMLAHNQCQDRYSQFGQVPDYIINQCVSNEVKSLYVIPSLGQHLGIEISKKELEKTVYKDVVAAYKNQDSAAESDDRLSLKELYYEEMQRNPMEVRLALDNTRRSYNAFRAFPVPDSVKQAQSKADSISFVLKAVHYTTVDLLRSLDSKVTITEEEIKKAYAEEQKSKPEAEKRPFESQKELVSNRLASEKKQKDLQVVKEALGKLEKGKYTLDDVFKLTGVSPQEIGQKSFNELKTVSLGSGSPVDMNKAEIYNTIAAAKASGISVSGPFQDGDKTYYIEISQVTVSDKEIEAIDTTEPEVYHGAYLLQYLIDQEATKGNFLFKSESVQ